MTTKLKKGALALAATALMFAAGATTVSAQSWAYTAGSPATISKGGWVFQVTEPTSGNLTVINCTAAPASASVLDFSGGVSNGKQITVIGDGGNPLIVGDQFGGPGMNFSKISGLVLPNTLVSIKSDALNYGRQVVAQPLPSSIPDGYTVFVPDSVLDIGPSAFYFDSAGRVNYSFKNNFWGNYSPTMQPKSYTFRAGPHNNDVSNLAAMPFSPILPAFVTVPRNMGWEFSGTPHNTGPGYPDYQMHPVMLECAWGLMWPGGGNLGGSWLFTYPDPTHSVKYPVNFVDTAAGNAIIYTGYITASQNTSQYFYQANAQTMFNGFANASQWTVGTPSITRIYFEPLSAASGHDGMDDVRVIVPVTLKPATTPLTSITMSTGAPVYGTQVNSTLLPSGATATYQWFRASTSGGSYTAISGATSSSYNPVAADIGNFLRVTATGSGSYSGSVSATSTAVAKADQAKPDPPRSAANLGDTIILNPIPGAEYRIGTTGTWQDSTTFTGLTQGTSYMFYARLKETPTHNASPISNAISIPSGKFSQATPPPPTMASRTSTSITLDTVAGAQYRISGGSWQSTTTFTGLNPGSSYIFYMRMAETPTHNASLSSEASFSTEGLIYTISATPQYPGFGSVTYGYAARSAVTVTIKNTGNQNLTLNALPTVANYTLSALSTTTLNGNGATATFTIVPNTGLAVGTYSPSFYVTGSDGVNVQVQPTFTVTKNTSGTWTAPSGGPYSITYGQSLSQVVPALPAGYTFDVPGTVPGAGSHNYAATFDDGNQTATGTITLNVAKASATVTITAGQTKVYDGAGWTTCASSVSGLVNGDTFATAFTGTFGGLPTSANVGTYAVTAGSLAAANYTFTFNSASLAITKAPGLPWKAPDFGNAYTIAYGETLSVITLPDGYAFVDPATVADVVGNGKTFPATYTDPSGNYESVTGTIMVNVMKAGQTTPASPTIASETTTSVTLDIIDGAEYSSDGGLTWQDSPVFTGLTPGETYTFIARIKETSTHNASGNSAGTTVTLSGPLETGVAIMRIDVATGGDVTLDWEHAQLDTFFGGLEGSYHYVVYTSTDLTDWTELAAAKFLRIARAAGKEGVFILSTDLPDPVVGFFKVRAVSN